MSDRPLLTLALLAYNQERYVREAVVGALAQTYQPLEVLLSDDASPDGTFAAMQEMAAAYRGPHRVRLNRNQPNLGLAGHVNRVMELAAGELIAAAAGDDVSEPERAAWAVEAWERSGRKAHSITSDVVPVLEGAGASFRKPPYRDQTLEEVISDRGPSIMGCSHVWHRRVFEVFGPLPPYVAAEDRAIAFRSLLLGGIAHDPRRAVRYRVHGGSLSFARGGPNRTRLGRRESWVRFLRYRAAGLRSFEADLGRAGELGLLPAERLRALLVLLLRERRRVANELALYAPSLGERLRGCRALWAGETKSAFSLRGKVFASLRAAAPIDAAVGLLDRLEASRRRRRSEPGGTREDAA